MKKTLAAMIGTFVLLGYFVSLSFGEESATAKSRFHFGLCVPYHSFSGNDFDSSRDLDGFGSGFMAYYIFPKVISNTGIGAFAGMDLGSGERFRVDVSYMQSSHQTASYPGDADPALYSLLTAELRYRLLASERAHDPFVSVGVAYPLLSLIGISTNNRFVATDYTDLTGYGYSVGLGMTSAVNSNVSLFYKLTYLTNVFTSVRNHYQGDIDSRSDLLLKTISLTLGVEFSL